MPKHMATLIGNCEQCPTHWRRPTTFLLPSLQSRGAVPSTRQPFQTLRHVHHCRIAPRGWAQPAHARHAHLTGNAMPRFRRPISVIRLKGRRTPHQDLKGPLIEITQPSISNQWATGGPPLVLISHPSGMTPDEERFYTENRST